MWLFQRHAAAVQAKAKAKTAARKARKKRTRPNRQYDPAKVKRVSATPEQIDELIALAKGRVPTKDGEWFYKQFISFSNGLAKTPAQAKHYLSQAHWVEDEDLRQQIRIVLWLFDVKDSVIADEYYKLAAAIRIYLIRDVKVFQKDQSHLQAMYQYDIELSKMEEPSRVTPNLDIVFEKHSVFSTFDKFTFVRIGIISSFIKLRDVRLEAGHRANSRNFGKCFLHILTLPF